MEDDKDNITRYEMVEKYSEFMDFCDWMYECELIVNNKNNQGTQSFEDYMNERFFWLSDVFKNRTIH
tara:strand:- start:1358 stop:1558 length:201 start_codon:yes stop_codon:yes gene_type:complete